MTLEEIKNTIKELTVQIEVITDRGIEKGTGVLINQEGNYYVVTVYHCIYGKNEESLAVSVNDIELEFYSTVTKSKLKPLNIESLSTNIVILQIDRSSILKLIQCECLDRVYYKKSYYLRGFPAELDGKAHNFEANCNDNDIDTISFSLELQNLTSDTSGVDTVDYISGISGSGVFFHENNKLYFVGLVNKLASHGGIFNRIDCIKLIDLHKSKYIDIKFSTFETIDDISKRLKKINKKIAEKSCKDFEKENIELYGNLNRKHSNIFEKQEVYEKNFNAIKKYLTGKNSVSQLQLISSSFEEDLAEIADDILDEVSSISKVIIHKRHGQENLYRIEDKTIEIIKEELKLIKEDRYISNRLQEYLVIGWLLNCNVDFILKDINEA